MTRSYLTKQQIQVISTITFGNILEWFEIYLFAFWAPVLAKNFFDFDSELANLISAFIVFGAGCIARPIGAIAFGRLGDIIGRKQSFSLSIVLLTIPTFMMGLLPTYSQIGILAPILMVLLRIFQGIPAGGEAPGAFCYLYENAGIHNRKFITSWGAVGNQIGAILSVLEHFMMETFLPEEFLIQWGWRISFWTGGLIGLFGIYLRHKLHETPAFLSLRQHHAITTETIREVVTSHKQGVALGTAFGVINAATFYLLASYIPIFFNKVIGLSDFQNVAITLSILFLTTILLPIFGIVGEKIRVKTIMVSSAILLSALSVVLFPAIKNTNLVLISAIGLVAIIPVTAITALLPYLLTHLFPTAFRFTCVGLSFNIADGFVGGLTPAISLLLLYYSDNQAAFCWFILGCSLISLISFLKIKD